jgi:hypothetical protein
MFSRTLNPSAFPLTTPRKTHPGERGAALLARGGGKAPSRGVEFASRQARTEGCNPCELSALHARRRVGERCAAWNATERKR